MTEQELHHAFTQAKNLAYDGGRLMLHAGSDRRVQKKGEVDLVTETDLAINRFLCTSLARILLHVDIVAEEGVAPQLQNHELRYAWVIDPIDGTSNFVHDLRHSAISIALYDRKDATSLLGIVYNPFSEECFTAVKGHGAYVNDTPLTVSKISALDDGLIGTGFAYDRKINRDNNIAEFKDVMAACHDLRRMGAASLDLAYVAAGRFDGYFERGLQFWDMAAGMLIVTEAGGTISRYDGTRVDEKSHHILATNGLIHDELSNTIARARAHAGLAPAPA